MSLLESLIVSHGRCFWCGTREFDYRRGTGVTLDHLVPRYMGDRKSSPVVLACARCNGAWSGKPYPCSPVAMAGRLMDWTGSVETALRTAKECRVASRGNTYMYWVAVKRELATTIATAR